MRRKDRIFVLIIRFLLVIFGVTWRVRYDLGHDANKKRFIYAFWHRYIMPLAYIYRKKGIGIIISKSNDGEIISSVVDKMGYLAIRGSSSNGGSEALRQSVRFLRKDGVLAITPDGPRGPLYNAHRGFTSAAQIAKVPIVPICVIARPAIRLKTWDKMLIPLPFASITIRSKHEIDHGIENLYDEVVAQMMNLEEWEN